MRTSTFWRVALNRNQNQLGKAIIVLRRHLGEVALLSPEEWDELHYPARYREPPADERIVGADVLAAIASAFRA